MYSVCSCHSCCCVRELCICSAVKVVRDSSSEQFVKISNTLVERTITVSLTSANVIVVKHVATSAVCRLE